MEEGKKNVPMGVLAYLGPLVLISYFVAKDDPFVHFHIKQGAVLLIVEVAVWFIGMMVWMFWPLLQLINLVVIILAIIGIINVVKGVEQELPVVGKYARYLKI